MFYQFPVGCVHVEMTINPEQWRLKKFPFPFFGLVPKLTNKERALSLHSDMRNLALGDAARCSAMLCDADANISHRKVNELAMSSSALIGHSGGDKQSSPLISF